MKLSPRHRSGVLAVVGALTLLGGCSDPAEVTVADTGPAATATPVPTPTPMPSPAVTPSPRPAPQRALPSALVGQWAVTGPGVDSGTVLNLGGRLEGLTLFPACGLLDGSWSAAPGGAFVADLWGGTSKCFRGRTEIEDVTPVWLATATAFRLSGDQRQLLDASGAVVATLRPNSVRPKVPKTASEEFADVPVLTAKQRAELDREPPALPVGVHAARPADLLALWVRPVDENRRGSRPLVQFSDDGTWFASDGCNGTGGRWALSDGMLLLTSGSSALIGCENVDVLSKAVRLGIADGQLVLIGKDGTEVRRLVRSAAPAPGPRN